MQNKYIPITKNIPKTILNRRFKKLQELIDNEEYFSEEQIRMRDPLLYFIYVGQYIRNQNKKPDSNFNLSEILIDQIQKQEYEIRLQEMYDKLGPNHDYPNLMIEARIKDTDLEDQEDILIRLMHDRFINGLDKDFINYEQIDLNEDYDDQKQMNLDIEEEYFENQNIDLREEEVKQSEYTGIQDY
ncbi:unnamed protein product [Paramecium pentaurelia]|uniref:CCD97-like C-terminal domain-containing protein n=1 Tax=Paramecium pentaurelia TaxID=43138 RepID=A0A8S1TMQ3_9CILI|nr:unnamed protein product [Paramecium pentaurelia]